MIKIKTGEQIVEEINDQIDHSSNSPKYVLLGEQSYLTLKDYMKDVYKSKQPLLVIEGLKIIVHDLEEYNGLYKEEKYRVEVLC